MAKHPEESPAEVRGREALDLILANAAFSRSRRLCALLQYLVEESLAGRGDKIKATTIAIDVYGRDETFDQQSDPIVRVEAGRLRQRLADYYRGAGATDPVVIEIPKGGYRPVFLSRPPEVTGAETAQVTSVAQAGPVPVGSGGAKQGRYPAYVWGGAIAVLLVATWVLQFALHRDDPTTPPDGPMLAEDKPYLVVMPVSTTPGDERSARIASGLVEALITSLSKLSGLSVMAHSSVLESQERERQYGLKEFRGEFGVTHLLRSSLETDGDKLVLYLQLVDARTAKVLWAERMTRQIAPKFDLEAALATIIATELAVQLQPGESERLAQSHAANAEAWLFYRQGLITIMPPRDLARVLAARQLFDRALELAPGFAGGYAGYSFSHSTRALFMNSDAPADELARAVALAEQAISLDPEFGAGHAMLALAQMLAGKTDAALESARRSVEIQPGDAFSQFIQGLTLILAAQPERALPHLYEALRLDPLETRMPYLNLMGIAYYNAADYSGSLAAIEKNYRRGGPRGPHLDVFIAASLAQLGEKQQAREVIARINSAYAEFPVAAWLERWLPQPGSLQETRAMLQNLGLALEK